MRIIYNPDLLFKDTPKEKIDHYMERIHEFVEAVQHEGGKITPTIIKRFTVKKFRETSIYKFYMNSSDAARCLIRYEELDEIFEGEPGLVLLQIVSHDEQGKIARQFDGKLLPLHHFIAFDEELDEEEATEGLVSDYVRRHFMRTTHIAEGLTREAFIKKFKDSDGRSIYKLSDKQLECLDAEGPVFLLGCAGSGKTLVEVSRALKNAHRNIKQAYFTFTPMLRETAEHIYKKYTQAKGIEGECLFYCMKDYFLEQCGLSEDRYFSFHRFQTWYKEKRFESKFPALKTIGMINLWIEIRGIIKGYAGSDCIRIRTFKHEPHHPNNVISDKGLQVLMDSNIVKAKTDSRTYFVVEDTEALLHHHHPDAIKLREHLHQEDLLQPLLDEYAYLYAVNKKYSLFDQKEKKIIFDFVKQEYQPYLENKENLYYDDNDLARMLMQRIKESTIELLDFVLVDELQDLTELQIIALAKIAKDRHNICMSGDVSQIINPTFFKLGRIGVIFKLLFNVDLKKDLTLDENYRNSESIVEISRKLLSIRRDKLGVYADDIEEESRELEKRVGLPFFIAVPEKELIEAIGTWLNIPKVAIIVGSEHTKTSILKRLKAKAAEANIYTVQEVKGYEFEKIVTYNIISEHEKEWTSIMEGNIDKGSEFVTRYKYYFNLLYVAITRGRNNLFMFEENVEIDIIQEILTLFEPLTDNFLEVMNLAEYDTAENRIIQAELHFKNQDYARARAYYLQLDDKRNAAKCTGYLHLQQGHFEEGVALLYQFKDEHDKAYAYTTRKELLLFRVILGYKIKDLSLDDIDRLIGQKSLIKLAKPYQHLLIYPQILKDCLVIIDKLYKHRLNQQLITIKGELNYETR